MTTDPRSMEEIRRVGLEALMQALGPVGMVRFLQYSESGLGDYTAERHQWLDSLSVADVAATVETRRHPPEES